MPNPRKLEIKKDMATTDKTPLWLDLKKQYIDDNNNKLQTYLQDYAEKGCMDLFYSQYASNNEGIGRFYIGLAEHIRILEGDELKKYASGYAKKFL